MVSSSGSISYPSPYLYLYLYRYRYPGFCFGPYCCWQDAVGEGLVDRLAMVCRAAPPELSPGPLTVLAHVVWWQGDGALARTALDQALAVDPDYRLAALLERMVDVAARPRATA